MKIFSLAYWLAIFVEMGIRAPLRKHYKTAGRKEQHVSRTERVLLSLLSISMLPAVIYSITGWLDFANYRLPPVLGWLGVLLTALALFLFWRGHYDLKTNWTPTLEIYEKHYLVTNGIYAYIRHPMYASQWVFAIAQVFVLQNWLAGPVSLLLWIPFYFLRTRAEEQMMLENFGEEYREYMKKTGAVFPKI